jgi:prophage endopeptidase
VIRAALYALALAAAFGSGWATNGWRWESRWSNREATIAEARAQSAADAWARESALADTIAAIDAARTAEGTKAREDLDALRARVDAGTVRLRVPAACPAARVPQGAAGPGLDPGTRAELAADARPDYFALHSGLTRVEGKLAACQQTLSGIQAEGS